MADRSDMASGKSAASSNGGDSEANMRAVGPYLLQRTLGKGQTGERERRSSVVTVCVFYDCRCFVCHEQDW